MEDGIQVNIEADVNDAIAYLKDIEGNGKKVQRAILNGVGTSTKNAIKRSYSSYLDRDSNNLYRNIKRKIDRKGSTVYIGSYARAENRVFYGHALSEGSTIKAKKDKYLTFQVDGKWVKKMEVKLPTRNWVQGPGLAYLNSPQYNEDLTQIINKQIEKIEKKRGWRD